MPSESEIKNNIQAVFNEVAGLYDANHFFTLSAKNLIAHADPDGFPNGSGRMLDVCSGTGIVAIQAARQYPGLKIDALDLSAGMLRQAEAKATALGICNIDFIVSDIDDFAADAPAYDLITCGYGLFFFPDMKKTFSKILSLLKPGGKLIFSSFTDQAFAPYRDMFLDALQRYGIETPDSPANRLQSAEQITDLCRQCGIADARVETGEIRYRVSTDDWWDLINSAAYKGLVNQLKEADRLDAFRQEHLSAIATLSGDGGIELNADSYYCVIDV